MTHIELPAEKRVGHLKLLRDPRSISPREFNLLSADERLEIVSRAQGGEKYRLLLEAADIEELVPQLAAQELYLLIRELGFEEVAELLPLVSSEQYSLFVDLDCWEGDRIAGAEVVKWLQALLDAGEEKALQVVRELDRELLVLMLKCHLRVVAGPEDIEDEDVRIEAVRRDGGYQLEFLDPEQGKPVALLLDLFFRYDQELFREVVEAVRWEQEALLEEDAYALHRSRLEESGFPEPLAARSIYAWLDADQLEAGSKRRHPLAPVPGRVPTAGFFLAAARPRDLLAEVLAAGVDAETAWELACLINKLMMAERVDIGDPQQVEAAAAGVYRYLNLALEELAGADSARAAEALADHYLEHLFRFGFTLTLRLQRRARELDREPLAGYLDAPFRALLDALKRRLPACPAALFEADAGGERPFATRRDLQRAEDWLAGVEVQLRLFRERFDFTLPAPADLELAGCLPERGEEATLSGLFLTALGNRLLGGEFNPTPVPVPRLAELHRLACAAGRLAPRLRQETVAWLEGLEAGAGAFGNYCLDRWEEEFCPLASDDLDPRFLGGLLVRLDGAA